MNITSPPRDGQHPIEGDTIHVHGDGTNTTEEVIMTECASLEVTCRQEVNMEGSEDVISLDNKEQSITTFETTSMNRIVVSKNQLADAKSQSEFVSGNMSSTESTEPVLATPVKQEHAYDLEDRAIKQEPVDQRVIKQEMKHEATTEEFQKEINFEGDSEGEEDSDFDPDGNSDSDDSDDIDAREKRQKAKIRAKVSKNVEKVLEALTNERNELIVQELMHKNLTDAGRQRLEEVKTEIAKIESEKNLATTNGGKSAEIKPKVKQFRAKDARAYWKHVVEQETQEENKKRKLDEDAETPKKSRKTQAKSHAGGALESLKPSAPDEQDESEPQMNKIQATTHAAQFKQIMDGIPEEFDTRRTATQKRDLKSAPKSFGFRKVSAIDGSWLLRGMATPMLSYQLVASSWMIMREAKELHPSGGLLADDMGLGKTITCIATIVGHPPDKEDIAKFCKTTLVITDGPQSAKQWYDQIEQHASDKLTKWTEVYNKTLGKKRRWWEARNVVIATYYDLLAQFPKKQEYKALKARYAGEEVAFRSALQHQLGPIFRTSYYRIILDEAHAIKNHESSNAKYKWVVSGTPLSNTVMEFYPYLRFIGSHFAFSRKSFSDEYVKSENSVKNFEALASMIMYRRKQHDKFLGQNLVTLPKAHSQDLWVPLSGWEMILDKVVDNHYKAELSDEQENEDGEGGSNDENQSPDINIDIDQDQDQDEDLNGDEAEDDVQMEDAEAETLVDAQTAFKVQTARCSRRRQLSSHPFNLEKFLRENDRETDIQRALERFQAEVSQLTANIDQQALNDALGAKYSLGLNLLEEKTQGLFGGADDMAKMLELASNEQKTGQLTCSLCDQESPPVEPTRGSNCEHVYCRCCLELAVRGFNQMKKLGQTPKPLECRNAECSAELDVGESVTTPLCIEKAVKASKNFKEPGQDSIGTRWSGGPTKHTSFFQATCGRQGIGYSSARMPMGAKVKATASVILTWQKEAPEDKIIVFIEFTRTAKALGCILQQLGLNFVYYNQMATAKQKDQALLTFKNSAKCKILVTSMKCGGQSLNLQVANRAIIVDIWWNKTVEDQAFKRIFRLGQVKETYLVRILASGSIDERVSQLQEAKEIIVASALQDDGHEPQFSTKMHLEMLFSTKSTENLIRDMKKVIKERRERQKEME
ncbi:hypothetical protein FGRMN_574 [Fusarium graminum]|nr:hypothetical protein FGRMN_574 [Fusarium graminum]